MKHFVESESDVKYVFNVGTMNSLKTQPNVTLKVNGLQTRILVDPGPSFNIMGETTFYKIRMKPKWKKA